MKKITLSLAIACLGISSMMAQTQRTILYEEFTGENCGPCAATNPGLTTFIHQAGYFPTKILLIRYQCNIPSAPGAGSLYADNISEEQVRQTFYSVPFAPYARFNGIVLPEPVSQGTGDDGHAYWIEDATDYPNIVPDSAIVNSPFGITVTHMFNAACDSVTVTAVITAAQAYTSSATGNLKLQVAMEEAAVHFANAPGTNGEKDFYDVMRKMVPNASGTTLNDSWTNGAMQTITQKIKIPTYIHDKNQIAFVAFVQDNGPKRVHNAAYSTPVSVNLDASTSAIANALVQCSTTITPMATIKNAGATTLTACNITYKLDAGTVNTYSWTGSLAQGTSTVVTLPNLTSAIGTHTLTIATALPNGGTDQNTANDSKKTNVIIQGTPSGTAVSQGFTAAAFPPTSWILFNADGTAQTWKRNASFGGYQTSTNSAEYDFYDNANDGDKDELYLPYEDLTAMTSPSLKYDYAYNYYDTLGATIYDSLAIMLSTDCGTTWTSLYLDGGPGLATAASPGQNSNSNGFFPLSSEWQSNTISLSAYATSNSVMVKFIAMNHYGNNLFIDNVNLAGVTGIKTTSIIRDVTVFPNPATNLVNISVKLSTSDKVTVTLYNVMGEQVINESHDLTSGDNNIALATDKLSSGIYSVVVSSAKGTYQTKVTISK